MNEYELAVMRTLTTKGFIKIRKRSDGCDFDAEKDGSKYLIEVKGGGQSEGFPLPGPKWSQIRELREAMDVGKKAILMFVNSNYFELAIFEMTHSSRIENTDAIRALLDGK